MGNIFASTPPPKTSCAYLQYTHTTNKQDKAYLYRKARTVVRSNSPSSHHLSFPIVHVSFESSKPPDCWLLHIPLSILFRAETNYHPPAAPRYFLDLKRLGRLSISPSSIPILTLILFSTTTSALQKHLHHLHNSTAGTQTLFNHQSSLSASVITTHSQSSSEKPHKGQEMDRSQRPSFSQSPTASSSYSSTTSINSLFAHLQSTMPSSHMHGSAAPLPSPAANERAQYFAPMQPTAQLSYLQQQRSAQPTYQPHRQSSTSSTDSDASLHLRDFSLVAEAAKRAQMACVTRDLEEFGF